MNFRPSSAGHEETANRSAAHPFHGLIAVALLAALAGCKPAEAPAPEIRPVRAITVVPSTVGDTASLTGRVQAQAEVNLSFRVDGRMTDRFVNIGDQVRAGQEVARLNPENEENGVNAAQATLTGLQAQLAEARANEDRNRPLLAQNFISPAAFDRIRQIRETAQAQVDAAQAQLNIARNRLGYTRLIADAGGVVTTTGAEPGEVVGAGRMVVQLAREEGRDAVFDVPPRLKDAAPAHPNITVVLATDPAVTAKGRVREVSPRADPATGTYQVRVGLIDPPAAMRLGTTVTGRLQLGSGEGIEIPASALVRSDRKASVWIVDPKTQTVSLRAIEVASFDPASVIVASGLKPGDIVVTAGVQALRPDQKVRLLDAQK